MEPTIKNAKQAGGKFHSYNGETVLVFNEGTQYERSVTGSTPAMCVKFAVGEGWFDSEIGWMV